MTHRKPVLRSLFVSLRGVYGGTALRPWASLTAGLGALSPLMALANPTGGQVVGGAAVISTPSANTTVINQSSQRAAINWQQFSVGANQYVQFLQPDSSAVVLNRVIGSNPSSIFGNITANGQVFLINPNGILFAPGATLDVAGLVASTLDLSDANFMQGNYAFSRGSSATPGVVQNQGSIVAGSGGYVVLAGDYVENDGHIDAQSGRVYLAAGNSATLTFDKNQLISYTVDGATLARLAGVTNTGEIAADGGAVVMTADVGNALIATAVNNSGFVAARSIQNESGEIVLSARGGDIDNSGTLDASATQAGVAGGTVLVRGDKKTELMPTSVITTAGDGAQGGFIELSGHTLHVGGQVDVGHGGNLLIDPPKLFITSGSTAAGVITSGGYVGERFIDNQLNLGVNVTLVASGSIKAGVPVGVPSVGPATNITAILGAGNLTIRTGTLTAGTGGSLANIGTNGNCVGAGVCQAGTAVRFTATSGNVNLTGLTIHVKGGVNIQASHGSVQVGAITANGIFIGGGKITINGNLSAPSASMGLSANPGSPAGGFIKAVGKTLSGRRVDLNVSATSYGGLISIGSINATSHAGISADVASGANPDTIKTGAITAPNILIHAAGLHENITTGPLTAVNAGGVVSITIDEKVLPGAGGSGNITVNGNITETGKTALTYGALSAVGLPVAAGLFINDGGSNISAARSLKINGNISLTGNRGSYHAGSCECGTPTFPHHLQHGSGGAIAAFINVTGSHGAASVTGSINAKAPDAFVSIQGHSVTVHNVTVTGSGHHVTRSLGPHSAGVSYASSNSAGQATVALGDVSGTTSYGGTTLVQAGNITVSGKGVAEAGLFGTQVSAGNISVTATAATGKIIKNQGTGVALTTCVPASCFNQNSSEFYRGISDVSMHTGSINGGRAVIGIAARANIGNGSSGAPAVSIKTGALGATGVGLADIRLDAKAVTTQALTVIATKGTEKGTGSSQSGGTAVNVFAHTFDINGGDAHIKIRSGGSGSHSSGVLTLNGGPVTIGGNVTVKGPAAQMDVKGKSIKIGGTVTVTGSGGSSTEKTVFTPAAGTGYTTSFNGTEPTTLNLQGATSGSVSMAGKATIKGPGLVGMIAVAGAVKLHGFSGSASAVKKYSVLDTRVSPTAVNFTAGSLAVIVSDVAASGGRPVFTSGVETGDMKFSAKGDVDLATRLNVSGTALVEAVGSIFGTSHAVVAHFNSFDAAHPHANSGGGRGGPKPGVLPASALQANAMAMVAGKGITLTGTQLNIGTGSFSSVHGDSTLIAGLAAEHLAPVSANPNGAFIAGGAVTLGDLKLTGSYLLLQGSAVSVLGKVTAPKGTLVQVEPFDLTLPIDIEDSTLLKSVLGSAALTAASGPTSFGLTNSSFLSLFPGDTIAVGGTGEGGDVTIGANGPLKLGSTNLIIYTTGNITGLGTVTSTGIVQSLLAFLGPPIPPVTAGEVDPTAGSGTNTGLGDQTDKRKIGGGGDQGGGTQPAGTVSQDTGNASVCH